MKRDSANVRDTFCFTRLVQSLQALRARHSKYSFMSYLESNINIRNGQRLSHYEPLSRVISGFTVLDVSLSLLNHCIYAVTCLCN